MKNENKIHPTKSLTYKAVRLIVILMVVFASINTAFWLMNKADTACFIFGIILLIVSIFLPIDLLIFKHNKNKQTKTTQDENEH